MTQANKGDGWTLDISKARSGGPGTESNRARAARGGFTFTMPSEPGTVIARLDTTGPEPVGSVSRDGGQTWEDAPRWPAGATTAHTATGGPIVLGAADGSGARRVVDMGRGISGVVQDGPLQHGRPINGHREMVAAYAAPGDTLRADPSPQWQAPAPQPDPAPGQVWLPPPGACPSGWCEVDGTLTVDEVGEHVVRFCAPAHGESRPCGSVEALRDPARGWTCIGVATPHGRVMVGDAFCFEDGHQRDVLTVLSGTTVDLDGRHIDAGDLLAQAERWRYAPARAGERLRRRTNGAVYTVTLAGGLVILDAPSGARDVYDAGPGGWAADPAQWERLDGGAAPTTLREACRDGARELREAADNLRRLGVEEPPTLDAIHAAFCAAALGPVETLAIHSRGEVTVYLPTPPLGVWNRVDALQRDYAARLPASTCLTVLIAQSVDVAALEGMAHRLIRGVPVRGRTGYEHAAAELAKRDLALSVGADVLAIGAPAPSTLTDDVEARVRTVADYAARPRVDHPRCRSVLVGTVEPGATLTLQAPARDLRALADAVGRALESTSPHHAPFSGYIVRVQRDELLFSPTYSTGSGASLAGDTRALAALRRVLLDAMASDDGRATLAQWGAKGPRVEVRREGGPVVAPAAEQASEPTRYDGANGGADQWRWEVGE